MSISILNMQQSVRIELLQYQYDYTSPQKVHCYHQQSSKMCLTSAHYPVTLDQ